METKKCRKCGKEKQLNSFYKDKTKKYGVSGVCILCEKKRYKKYYKENKENIIKKVEDYRAINLDKIKERGKIYRANNKIKLKKTKYDYSQKTIQNLEPTYIKRLLIVNNEFLKEEITEEIITLKRGIIKTNRVIKQIKTKQDE